MTPVDPLGAFGLLLSGLTMPIQLALLLVITIIQALLGQPTFCSSPSVCL